MTRSRVAEDSELSTEAKFRSISSRGVSRRKPPSTKRVVPEEDGVLAGEEKDVAGGGGCEALDVDGDVGPDAVEAAGL